MKTLTPSRVAAFAVLAFVACNRERPAEPTQSAIVDRDHDGVVDRDRDRDGDGIVDTDRDGLVRDDRHRAVDRDDARDRDGRDGSLRPASRVAPAAESIAQARCARERRCENVGANEKYASMNECMTSIRNDWKDDLTARECPRGIDQKELQECLTAIRNEDCGNPFDTLGRVAECTAAQICDDDPNH